MKTKILVITALVCFQATAVFAQDESRFQSGEWDLSPFATYVDKEGDNWGLGASATYFVTKYIGIGGCTYWTDFQGTFIDNAAAEGYFRLPLLKSVSPYAVGSIGYQFDSEEWMESFGAGVDFRPFKRITAFSDIQYRIAHETRDGVWFGLICCVDC